MIQARNLKYRPDIDGLRAIAVLSVIGFHAFPYKFPGGFIGVDIFFVISGYLISSIIFSNLDNKNFSILDFYRRRILRIYPALILIILVCLGVGWGVLFSQDYARLGLHTAGGAAFISNFLLWNEASYFDEDARFKPLLHLWSLAIEEQFYIFWPLLLQYVWAGKRNVLTLITLIGCCSFLIGLYLIHKDPTAAFYFPGSRFWELMLGGFLAYKNHYKQDFKTLNKNLQSVIGVILIGIALLTIRQSSLFPGWWALLPTLGAFFIISAGPTALINEKILSRKWMVRIGLISYPLYLWHWPILVYTNLTVGQVSSTYKVGLIALTFILSLLTYKLIEKPLHLWKQKRFLAIGLFSGMALLGMMGITLSKIGGLEGNGIRTPEKSAYLAYFENSRPDWNYFKKIDRSEKYRYECDFYDLEQDQLGNKVLEPRDKIDSACFTRKSAASKVVFIWGDSHAQHLYWGLKQGLSSNWEILQVASSGCAPSLVRSKISDSKYCDQSNSFALNSIKRSKPDFVIVAQNVGHNLDMMNKISQELRAYGVNEILFIGPTPHWNQFLPKIIAGKLWENTPKRTNVDLNQKVISENEIIKKYFVVNEHQKFISLIDFFCNQEGCLTYLGEDKEKGLISYDYGHLTPIASEYLANQLLIPLIENNKN